MNKNPYEIRLELLKMAKEMLDKQYQQASDVVWNMFSLATETNKELYKDYEKYIPKMFTPEEIISQAEKLQEFVNRKE